MSQVKNLRAMFENKGDTSPPDRGRASGASTPVLGGTDSPRPLSKVRTNFVAVEKDGRIGLRRDPSHESSVSRRRLSMDTDAESVSTAPDKNLAGSEDVVKGSRAFFNEPIPESPRQPPEPENKKTEEIGAVTDKPSTNPDKHIDEESPNASLSPGDPFEKSPIKEKKPAFPPVAVNGKAKTKVDKPKEPKEPKELKEAKQPTPAAAAKPAAVKKAATRPGTITTKPTTTTKPPAKSPSVVKTPTSTAHKTDAKPAAKAHERLAVKKEPSTTAKAASSATKPTASNVSKKPQSLKPSTSDAGFVKPKPKSPTKPVHLPASLMAPTASSVSKGNAPRQSLSRQSNTTQSHNATGRSPSRAGASTSATGATAGKTIKRQSSTISRSRPSLGPPPKKTAQDHPVSKKESHVDEGFLARMMRPTQASSSKVADKVPTTPPRKTAKRPSTGADHKLPHETSSKSLENTKKPAKKPATSTTSSDAPNHAENDTVSADEPTPEVAQVDLKTVDVTKGKVNELEQPRSSVEETKESGPIPEPSTEEAAVEIANVDTAEEAIELAKEADLVEEPVKPKESVSELEVDEPAPLEDSKDEAQTVEPSTKEVAIEAANVETAQEAIELAKEANLVEEPLKTGDTKVSKDEPVAVNIDTPMELVKDEPVEDVKKAEVTKPEDVPWTDSKKETDEIVEEKSIEETKQESETTSKEAITAN